MVLRVYKLDCVAVTRNITLEPPSPAQRVCLHCFAGAGWHPVDAVVAGEITERTDVSGAEDRHGIYY